MSAIVNLLGGSRVVRSQCSGVTWLNSPEDLFPVGIDVEAAIKFAFDGLAQDDPLADSRFRVRLLSMKSGRMDAAYSHPSARVF